MTERCEQLREEMLEFGWSHEECERARRVAEHLETCEACRVAAADYEALRSAVAPAEAVEPAGGWEAFEMRLARTARPSRFRIRWGMAIAAGLLVGITLLNGWMLARNHGGVGPVADTHTVNPVVTDMPQASVVKAFKTVSEVFEGRTNWIMLSNQSSELGLAEDRQTGAELLVLTLVVKHGDSAVSQMHFAIVPGATVRVSAPSESGQELQYVITTDAADLQSVGVSMAVEGSSRKSADAGVGSMATSLRMPFGKSTPTGQITTRDGTFDLSMTLEKSSRTGA